MSTLQKNNLIKGNLAIKELLKGIKTATSAIRVSYGARGVNAIIEQEFYPYHLIANDCETILQSIVIDPNYGYEKIGLDLLKELSAKAHKDSGDGRKTTCIMAEEIIELGHTSGKAGVQLKNELDALIPIIEKNIDDQKVPILPKDVHTVATIAGESVELGKILGEIYKEIGVDGVIHPEASGTHQTSYEFIDGIRFADAGYLSSYMVHDEDAKKEKRKESKAVYRKPTVLVTKRKISSLDDINPLLEMLSAQGKKDLVIFTDDMDSGVASILVKAHTDKVFNILIIKAPVLWKNYVFEDFAKVTGSTIVEDASGINYKNLKLEHLGTCDKITVDDIETTIIGGADIKDHIANLKKKGDNDSLLRISWLTTKNCILRLGANNESELSYRRLKCYDAINASKLALKDGIVPGGGIALLNAAVGLPSTTAGRILQSALKAPYIQLMTNTGHTYQDHMEKVIFRGGLTHGWDAVKDKPVEMFGAGIVDASAVVKNAVRNAISLASTVLTGHIVVRLPHKTAEQLSQEALKGKGLRF